MYGESGLLWEGPLAQSVERGADNAKVVSSRLTWTNFLKTYCIVLLSLPT